MFDQNLLTERTQLRSVCILCTKEGNRDDRLNTLNPPSSTTQSSANGQLSRDFSISICLHSLFVLLSMPFVMIVQWCLQRLYSTVLVTSGLIQHFYATFPSFIFDGSVVWRTPTQCEQKFNIEGNTSRFRCGI